MSPKSHTKASLVVVELGAAWPAALVGSDARAACRVLAEIEGEGPLAFAARLEDFVVRAFARGTELELAVVACNQRADETAGVARRAMSECLLARLSKSGTLHFSAADAASERFRRRLQDLVAELARSSSAAARVQTYFAEEASRTTSSPASADSQSTVARVA